MYMNKFSNIVNVIIYAVWIFILANLYSIRNAIQINGSLVLCVTKNILAPIYQDALPAGCT